MPAVPEVLTATCVSFAEMSNDAKETAPAVNNPSTLKNFLLSDALINVIFCVVVYVVPSANEPLMEPFAVSMDANPDVGAA